MLKLLWMCTDASCCVIAHHSSTVACCHHCPLFFRVWWWLLHWCWGTVPYFSRPYLNNPNELMHTRYTGGKQRSCFIQWCWYLKTAKAAVIDHFVHAPFFNDLYLKNWRWLFGDLLSGPVLFGCWLACESHIPGASTPWNASVITKPWSSLQHQILLLPSEVPSHSRHIH